MLFRSSTLLSGFDLAAFPALRKKVRASRDTDTFHFAAAAILAHYGDKGILKDLMGWQTEFDKAHAAGADILGYYVWQINVQAPPSQLLDFIASPEHFAADPRANWAVRRAVALELDAADVRDAILTRAKKVKPRRADGIRPGIADLK